MQVQIIFIKTAITRSRNRISAEPFLEVDTLNDSHPKDWQIVTWQSSAANLGERYIMIP